MENFAKILSQELGKSEHHIQNVIDLLADGNTIPFIARYRKEMHGTMDDTTLRALEERLNYLKNLSERMEEVKSSIENQGKLTQELALAIDNAKTLSEVEDLYRPYKQKRRTRATIAKEKGLEPLAEILLAQSPDMPEPLELAAEYINAELGVESAEDALSGACDIIAEIISDDAEIRKLLKAAINEFGSIISRAAKEEDSVYRNYYEAAFSVKKVQGHQILAMNRGENEEFLKVGIEYNKENALQIICSRIITGKSKAFSLLALTAEDAYDRLIFPSVEREIRNDLFDLATDGAIKNFALNLKPLIMQPPVKGKVTLGFDPAYRTGCKLAVVDENGKVLDTGVIYPTPPHNKIEESKKILKNLISKYSIENISIGNGTASRESENFVAELLAEVGGNVKYIVVNEAGASVYSASELGAKEFPEFDVSLRSAVSIARRLQDPMAELVKIDPKSIGVGQYQHDMPQKKLGETLSGVVEDCVNAVGIDLNTASPSLLSYAAGLNSATAQNVVTYREENGSYTDRKQLLKVPKLGKKAFEQCAGFLRIPESKNVFDNTGVHPESYDAAKKLIEILGFEKNSKAFDDIEKRLEEYGKSKAAEQCGVGVPTITDIAKELSKPGRDIRDDLPSPIMRSAAMEISDLTPGMEIMGTVRNVIDFGAFVDIGVHQDGLVHISQICSKFIKHPSEVLSVGDIVKVKVLEVDAAKKRISLTMKF
ncbi:MAG: RNA-binding transcriptional accessory protein [Clostridia bacterium]|nr:RNA-binding transcriptional accessory protein [Clostridia bacterium]